VLLVAEIPFWLRHFKPVRFFSLLLAFLYNFVPKECDWIHLDIAGVDYLYYDKYNRNMGATSVILRSVFNFLENL